MKTNKNSLQKSKDIQKKASKEYRPPSYKGDYLVSVSFVDWGGDELSGLAWDNLDLVDISAFEPTKGGGIDYSSDIARDNFNKLSSVDTCDTTLIAKMGGWTGSQYFSDAALPENRDKFAEKLVKLLRKHDLDGVEVNWEFPSGGGLPHNVERPEDPDNYYPFLETIREALDEAQIKDDKNYYLSISNTASNKRPKEYDVARISDTINFMKLQGYGIVGDWSKVTGFQDQLYGVEGQKYEGNGPIDYTINLYKDEGFDSKKIVIGIPSSGRVFTDVPNINKGVHQPFESQSHGMYYRNLMVNNENDTMSFYFDYYYEQKHYCDTLPGFYIDRQLGSTWLYSKKKKLFISMPTAHSMAMLVEYVKENDAIGFQMWTSLYDDDQHTLIKAIKGAEPAELEPTPEPYSVL